MGFDLAEKSYLYSGEVKFHVTQDKARSRPMQSNHFVIHAVQFMIEKQ